MFEFIQLACPELGVKICVDTVKMLGICAACRASMMFIFPISIILVYRVVNAFGSQVHF